ncbi:hypothetical protein ACWDZX_33195, partial [Streptomyces collinus]
RAAGGPRRPPPAECAPRARPPPGSDRTHGPDNTPAHSGPPPAAADDDAVAAVRRRLLHEGRAVLGRARLDGRLWLKATLLNPHTRPDELAQLLKLVEGTTPA